MFKGADNMGIKFWSMDGDRSKPFTGLTKALVFFVLAILLLAVITGCANVTVVKLAELCYGAQGKPATSFVGESGRVDCK